MSEEDEHRENIKKAAQSLLRMRKTLHFLHLNMSKGLPNYSSTSNLEDCILNAIHWNTEVIASLAYEAGKEQAEALGIKHYTNEYEAYRKEYEQKRK